MGYHQIKEFEREYLYSWNDAGVSLREIARRLKRSASSISRELKRNSHIKDAEHLSGYSKAHKAHSRALRERKGTRMRIRNVWTRTYIVEKLKLGWSPELIAGRLKSEHEISICTETIYQWIYKECRELINYLVRVSKRGNRKRNSSRRYRNKKKSKEPKRKISERPKSVETREEFGHWEGDTIVSQQSTSCVYTLIERVSRKVFFSKLQACQAKMANDAAIMRLDELAKLGACKTLTLDNGSENAGFNELEKRLNIDTYFCDPYCSWQRGSVENINGILRRFFPKKTDFKKVSAQQIQYVQDWFNNRPMKVLAFKTPNEVFDELMAQNSS